MRHIVRDELKIKEMKDKKLPKRQVQHRLDNKEFLKRYEELYGEQERAYYSQPISSSMMLACSMLRELEQKGVAGDGVRRVISTLNAKQRYDERGEKL